MNASSWMFEWPFGAMNGFRGGSGAYTGDGFAGLPMNAGSEFGLSGIGVAADATPAHPRTQNAPAIQPRTKRLLASPSAPRRAASGRNAGRWAPRAAPAAAPSPPAPSPPRPAPRCLRERAPPSG